ncbi:MAG: hypothetical protein Ct9H300mP16_19750 [Pseudomonadota bacterium]|nr:MAG: hypothetical protein Ct9H300mP16_19750 [Pseudomonadota bacterium]
MFGFACNETDVLMPFPITYAHRLVKQQSEVRRKGTLPWLRPDAKSQVSVCYEDGRPVSIDTVVLSTQHGDEVGHKTISEAVIEEIIKPVLPQSMVTDRHGTWSTPPAVSWSVDHRRLRTDRAKNHCRHLRGSAHHGGGAFSGKDPLKVDRSAAYAIRHVAQECRRGGTGDQCEVQVAYAIGVAEPVSLMVNTAGTSVVEEETIEKLVRENFDLRPKAIIEELDCYGRYTAKRPPTGISDRMRLSLGAGRQGRRLRDAAGLGPMPKP